MTAKNETYQKLVGHVQRTGHLKSTMALLQWDQQTQLASAGHAYRAEQMMTLAGMIHQREVAPEVGDWLNELLETELASDRHSVTGSAIHELQRQYQKKAKLPQALVESLARATSIGQQIWAEARQENDFSKFAPQLTEIFQLKREEADALGFEQCRYDALLDEYEPGAKTGEIESVLDQLRADLVPLVQAISQSENKIPVDIVHREFPVSHQRELGLQVASEIGFDFDSGRLDVTTHPFCTTLGPRDCRITTRYNDHYFNGSFFGTMHEAGHGIYEQGLDPDQFGLPAGTYCSLGIHESQSRLWENLVGRSFGFWKYFYPLVQKKFDSLTDISLEQFHAAINHSSPSLIRVEADEATYDLHIIIRFELEKSMLDDEFPIRELPDAWNNKYEQYLGIRPDTDALGCLQDVHWSAGLVGYFPTYSLGNICASQFFARANDELGNLEEKFERGEFAQLKQWLNSQIHSLGGRYRSSELVEKVVGQPMNHEKLIDHLKHKFGKLYELSA